MPTHRVLSTGQLRLLIAYRGVCRAGRVDGVLPNHPACIGKVIIRTGGSRRFRIGAQLVVLDLSAGSGPRSVLKDVPALAPCRQYVIDQFSGGSGGRTGGRRPQRNEVGAEPLIISDDVGDLRRVDGAA